MCDHDVKQLYAELKEVQKRVLDIEKVAPFDRIASDESNDISTKIAAFCRNSVCFTPTKHKPM